MRPQRVQLSRAKGWRMPPNTVSVARPGRFGNPFKVGELRPSPNDGAPRPRSAAEAVAAFRDIATEPGSGWQAAALELRGKNLACWCKPGEPCHADVLLELANAEGGQ